MNKILYINKEFPKQPQEQEYGNKEYKWKILPDDKSKMKYKCNKLASQMMYRIYEGNGKAIYLIGVLDNGTPIGLSEIEIYDTIQMFNNITDIINCNINKIRLYKIKNKYIATIRIYKNIL